MKDLILNKRQQKGLAALETTLIMPLFFLFFALTAEFGKIYYDYLTLTKLQRNAIRFLSFSVNPGTNQIADLTAGDNPVKIAQAKNLILYGSPTAGTQTILNGMTANDIQVTALADGHIQIATTYPATPIFGDFITSMANMFSSGNESLNINLSSSSVMKIL